MENSRREKKLVSFSPSIGRQKEAVPEGGCRERERKGIQGANKIELKRAEWNFFNWSSENVSLTDTEEQGPGTSLWLQLSFKPKNKPLFLTRIRDTAVHSQCYEVNTNPNHSEGNPVQA